MRLLVLAHAQKTVSEFFFCHEMKIQALAIAVIRTSAHLDTDKNSLIRNK